MTLHSTDNGKTITEAPADCRCIHCVTQKVLALVSANTNGEPVVEMTLDLKLAWSVLTHAIAVVGSRMDEESFVGWMCAIMMERERAQKAHLFVDDEVAGHA